jgi:hypothetical protein
MSMQVNAQADQIAVDLEVPRRTPPKSIRLRIPGPGLLKSVRVNDQPLASFDADSGWITLRKVSEPDVKLHVVAKF